MTMPENGSGYVARLTYVWNGVRKSAELKLTMATNDDEAMELAMFRAEGVETDTGKAHLVLYCGNRLVYGGDIEALAPCVGEV